MITRPRRPSNIQKNSRRREASITRPSRQISSVVVVAAAMALLAPSLRSQTSVHQSFWPPAVAAWTLERGITATRKTRLSRRVPTCERQHSTFSSLPKRRNLISTELFSTRTRNLQGLSSQETFNRTHVDKVTSLISFNLPGTTHEDARTMDPKKLLSTWRDLPVVNPILVFNTLLIPSALVQSVVQHPSLQMLLAKPNNWELLQHVHPRIKLVQDYNATHKQVLLLSGRDPTVNTNNSNQQDCTSTATSVHLHQLVNDLDDPSVKTGAPVSVPVSYQQLSFQYILQQLLPLDLLPPPTSYEQIGHIAHFNLKEQYKEYQELIGQVLVETTPGIDTVVQKVGQVSGKYRTYNYDMLANRKNHNGDASSSLETTVTEDGVQVELDVAECYWSTRLSGERQEVLKEIHRSTSPLEPLVVADVFCGVGAVCLLLAKQRQRQQLEHLSKTAASASPVPTTSIIANDWNPTAIKYFKKSIHRNNLDASQFQLSCLEAYDFLMDLGVGREDEETGGGLVVDDDTAPGVVVKHGLLPDHVLMNFPLDAPKFLGALRWWSWRLVRKKNESGGRYPRFHVYTFARATTVGANDEEEVAVDIIANELLPDISISSGKMDENDAEEDIACHTHRRQELDTDFDAEVSTRLVRDVAPGKVVVCVSFSLTPKLIRYMQGEYY